ncbi:MAG: hypothetical protein IJO02_07645, partial [Clostridia bacterium]|nr:hypothetical protein [Clostridia bacterium]
MRRIVNTFSLIAFLLMTTLAASAAAQMNYELNNPNLIYTPLEADEGMPVLVDVLDEAVDPQDVQPIEEAQPEKEADTWPKIFTITVGGDTTLGSTDDLRK